MRCPATSRRRLAGLSRLLYPSCLGVSLMDLLPVSSWRRPARGRPETAGGGIVRIGTFMLSQVAISFAAIGVGVGIILVEPDGYGVFRNGLLILSKAAMNRLGRSRGGLRDPPD